MKASGKEFLPETFPNLVESLRLFIAKGMKITLVFGGGEQIDREWKKKHAEPRPKIDGIGVTNEALLNDAVLPAFEDIRQQLHSALPELTILGSKNLGCKMDENRGLVGIPERLDAVISLTDTAIGFVGNVEGHQVNVNADDATQFLVDKFGDHFNEIIMLTDLGGVVDMQRGGRLVPLILSGGINEDGSHKSLDVTGGMRKKLLSVRGILPHTGKVAITNSANLPKEVEDWRGGGTLCVQEDQMKCSSMRDEEREIFLSVFEEFAGQGYFRERTGQELDKVIDHHRILRIMNSPLGGFSLVPREGDWAELEVLWSGYMGNGVGDHLIQNAIRLFGEMDCSKMFLLSTLTKNDDENQHALIRKKFLNSGFILSGRISDLLKADSDIPIECASYDTSERDPYLFTYKD